MDEDTRERIVAFVQQRNQLIRNGDRSGLDATYQGLNSRNQYNRHDYDWYLDMIEQGFGDEIQRIDIVPLPESRQDPESRLPFDRSTTYTWFPEYKVFVEVIRSDTGDKRRTLWLVREMQSGGESCLKVVLPNFGGRTKDEISRGEFTPLDTQAAESEKATKPKFAFVPEKVVELLIDDLVPHIVLWKRRLAEETIRALTLDCFPWFGTCYLSVLTANEDFDEASHGKWCMGDWRYNEDDDSEFVSEGVDILVAHYQGDTLSSEKTEDRVREIFECLARALTSEQVTRRLSGLDLAADFELGVFDPDDPNERNYCDLVGEN